jgi:type I restriction enzyme S subunit
LPPVDEQRRIVAKLDALTARSKRARAELERVTGVTTDAKSTLALLDRLDQAILAKAFRGELVAHDPNDEPASVLLDRIRAARGPQPATRARRRSARTAAASA